MLKWPINKQYRLSGLWKRMQAVTHASNSAGSPNWYYYYQNSVFCLQLPENNTIKPNESRKLHKPDQNN